MLLTAALLGSSGLTVFAEVSVNEVPETATQREEVIVAEDDSNTSPDAMSGDTVDVPFENVEDALTVLDSYDNDTDTLSLAGKTDVKLVQFCVGDSHIAAIDESGNLWRYGDGGISDPDDAVFEIITEDASAVEVNDNNGGVVKKDGSLFMWGLNENGQIGNGTTQYTSEPVKVLEDVEKLSLGGDVAAAIKKDGSLWTWGWNQYGQNGTGFTENVLSPVKIMDDVADVRFGGDGAAALKKDGSLYAWGSGLNISDQWTESTPVKIMEGVAKMDVGGDFIAAIKSDGSLWTVGYNTYGQLGDGTNTAKSEPVQIIDGGVSEICCGGSGAGAVKTDGTLLMWGDFNSGDLTDTTHTTPAQIANNVKAFNHGNIHAACIKNDNTLWTWGKASGALGDGTNENRFEPKKILDNVTAMSFLESQGGAITEDGNLWLWGGSFGKSPTLISLESTKPDPGPAVISVNGVTLDRHEVNDLSLNNKVKLTATVNPSDATNRKVTWSVSDNTVVTVDADGNVTGKKAGTTVITVTTEDGGYTDTCMVTVVKRDLKGISFNEAYTEVEVGKTKVLNVVFDPVDASNKNLVWTVSDNKIATVSDGKVTGVAIGSTVVTAKSEEGGFTASCNVTVKAASDPEPKPSPDDPAKETHTVTFMNGDTEVEKQEVEDGACAKEPANKPVKDGYTFIGWTSGSTLWNFSMPIYSSLILNAKFVANKPEAVSENTGSGKDAIPVVASGRVYLVKGQTYIAGGNNWTVRSGPAVVTVVKNTGKITAKKWGGAVVGNDNTTLSVNVAQPFFEKSGKTITLLVGETKDIKKNRLFNLNSPVSGVEEQYPVTWEAVNPKVAIINDGKVTALAKGSTGIRAYVGGKTYTATVKVLDQYKAPAKLYSYSSFTMNPLQTFTLKYDVNKTFKVNGATWSGDGMEPTVHTKGNKKGQPDGGYQNKIVSITKNGKIKAIGEGETKITGKDVQGREVTLTVTVAPVSTKVNTFITKGKNETIKFPFVTNSKAVWTSSNTEVIPSSGTPAVEKNFKKGVVKGEKVGSSLITCSFNGFRFSTLVYVEDPTFVTEGEGNKLIKNGNNYELKLKVGETYNRVRMQDVFQTYNLKSSSAAVAFVDENGIVYARKKGKANISTTINGKAYKIAVTVEE